MIPRRERGKYHSEHQVSMVKAAPVLCTPLTHAVRCGIGQASRTKDCSALRKGQSCDNLPVKTFKLVRRHIITMTVKPDRVVESFNVFENESVGLASAPDSKPVQPLSFNQGMEGFDTCVVVRISFSTVAQLEFLSGLKVCLRNKLSSTIRVQNKRLVRQAFGFS